MNKVKKILTTLMAATLTVSTGLTSMPMFAHNVKAESKAETISSDTNDMSQYKKINGISSQTVLGADFSPVRIPPLLPLHGEDVPPLLSWPQS